jgi:hypothetical protein
MRIVKQRLLEMMPDIHVFLEYRHGASKPGLSHSLLKDLSTPCGGSVDNLEDIGGLDNYIHHSTVILVYCSSGYYESKNCMRELVSSTIRKKPVIALVDSDGSRGGLTREQVHLQLIHADDSYPKWGFDPEVSPGGQALNDHLFENDPIEVRHKGGQTGGVLMPY